MSGTFPVAYWGTIDEEAPPLNWRARDDTPDPDDEELEKTPQDVIDMLGFDPKSVAP